MKYFDKRCFRKKKSLVGNFLQNTKIESMPTNIIENETNQRKDWKIFFNQFSTLSKKFSSPVLFFWYNIQYRNGRKKSNLIPFNETTFVELLSILSNSFYCAHKIRKNSNNKHLKSHLKNLLAIKFNSMFFESQKQSYNNPKKQQ